ncbi:MAG: carboxypeptidase-like regulatory domain-containing protein, partial [Terriglobia bacterium]
MNSIIECARTNFGRATWWVVLAAFIAVSSAFAQTTGGILGTVRDQSDAVVPGAAVTVRNVETGAVRRAVAGTGGEYRFSNLAVGSYEVQVEQA